MLVSPVLLRSFHRLVVANCTSCHDTGVFSRPDHNILSLEALRHQLTACGHGANKEFSAAQADSIVKYLNERFYRFSVTTSR